MNGLILPMTGTNIEASGMSGPGIRAAGARCLIATEPLRCLPPGGGVG